MYLKFLSRDEGKEDGCVESIQYASAYGVAEGLLSERKDGKVTRLRSNMGVFEPITEREYERIHSLFRDEKELLITAKDGEWSMERKHHESFYDLLTRLGQTGAEKFSDVPASSYCADAVSWAVEQGITNGTAETAFSPGAVCSRLQVMTFLWRASDVPEPMENEAAFSDMKDADGFAFWAAQWAAEEGLVSGTVFAPNAPCTQGQIVTLLYQAMT